MIHEEGKMMLDEQLDISTHTKAKKKHKEH